MTGSRAARVAVAMLVVAALLGAVGTYVLSPPPIPEHSNFELDLRELRRLASVHSGSLPRRVNVAIVAESTKPAAGVLGGVRFDKNVFVWTSFQVVADDRFIVIDAPPDEGFHREGHPSDRFSTEQYDAVQRAMLDADMILVTHEHPDHIGGIARSPYLSQIVDRLLLTTEQARNRSAMQPVAFPLDVVRSLRPLDYERYYPLGACRSNRGRKITTLIYAPGTTIVGRVAFPYPHQKPSDSTLSDFEGFSDRLLAPGVVLVRAPGHTTGSQLVYVQLEDGAELLLVGDVAWHRTHIEEPRGRPRISSWLMGEDHEAVASQLRALHELAERSSVRVVISHDREQLASYIAPRNPRFWI